jgi:hypothetical protein
MPRQHLDRVLDKKRSSRGKVQALSHFRKESKIM